MRAETQPRRPLQTWGCLPPRAEAPFANPHTDPHSCPSLPPALSSHSSPWITQNTMKQDYRASLEAQMVKNLPALQETRFDPPGRCPGEGIGYQLQYQLQYSWASLMAQTVKNPPEMGETWVQSLGRKDHLEEDMATHSSILARPGTPSRPRR